MSFFLCVYSKIGEEQSPEDAEDGPPELLVGVCICNINNDTGLKANYMLPCFESILQELTTTSFQVVDSAL